MRALVPTILVLIASGCTSRTQLDVPQPSEVTLRTDERGAAGDGVANPGDDAGGDRGTNGDNAAGDPVGPGDTTPAGDPVGSGDAGGDNTPAGDPVGPGDPHEAGDVATSGDPDLLSCGSDPDCVAFNGSECLDSVCQCTTAACETWCTSIGRSGGTCLWPVPPSCACPD